jgi:pimeloyl-ACP methyl ester carboxylesterase
MVDVGGYEMHIHCTGEGSPTVILEAGWSDFSLLWTYVQAGAANITRVCSYDRAGNGWSERSPHARSAKMMVQELHTLLANANIPGPYVLVGHSMGGVLMRVYTHNYPEEVVGMVLVDSVHEEQFSRYPEAVLTATQDVLGQFRLFGLLSSAGIMAFVPQSIPNRGLSDEALAQYRAVLSTTRNFETYIAEWNSLEESYAEILSLHITDFGDMPLVVLSRGRPDPSPLVSDIANQQVWEIMQEWQSRLVGLSSAGKQVIAAQSGHHIQLDQPDLVIDAVREIVDTAQK